MGLDTAKLRCGAGYDFSADNRGPGAKGSFDLHAINRRPILQYDPFFQAEFLVILDDRLEFQQFRL